MGLYTLKSYLAAQENPELDRALTQIAAIMEPATKRLEQIQAEDVAKARYEAMMEAERLGDNGMHDALGPDPRLAMVQQKALPPKLTVPIPDRLIDAMEAAFAEPAPGEVFPLAEHIHITGYHWVRRGEGAFPLIWTWRPEDSTWVWYDAPARLVRSYNNDRIPATQAAYADGWRYLGPVAPIDAEIGRYRRFLQDANAQLAERKAENARLRDQLAALGVFDFGTLEGMAAAQRYGVAKGFVSAEDGVGETCIAFWERQKDGSLRMIEQEQDPTPWDCKALRVIPERPDKDLETTKDFPSDFTHGRVRDVIKDVLDGSIKPGGRRELKRAIDDREKIEKAAEPSARDKALGRAIRFRY